MNFDLVIYTDGGARSNPGPAGAGGVVYKGDEVVAEISAFLGTQTNNWAEYEALILSLEAARDTVASAAVSVLVHMDSELIVKQMKGEYRVKDPQLKKQYERVQSILQSFSTVQFEHVRREYNKRADQLANNAMDRAHGDFQYGGEADLRPLGDVGHEEK